LDVRPNHASRHHHTARPTPVILQETGADTHHSDAIAFAHEYRRARITGESVAVGEPEAIRWMAKKDPAARHHGEMGAFAETRAGDGLAIGERPNP